MDEVEPDGRVARRERNRQAVVDAALELLDEGQTGLCMEDITARSGVSERSVFRYFETLDDLRRALVLRNYERFEALLDPPGPEGGSLAERVARLVDLRVRLFERVQGPARLGRERAHLAPLIEEDTRVYTQYLEDQLRMQFAPELAGRRRADRDELVATMNVLVGFDGWEAMGTSAHRSPAQIRRAWKRALQLLLESPAA